MNFYKNNVKTKASGVEKTSEAFALSDTIVLYLRNKS